MNARDLQIWRDIDLQEWQEHEQLNGDVSQYITLHDCHEYPKIEIKFEKTKLRFNINFYIYPSKRLCFQRSYMSNTLIWLEKIKKNSWHKWYHIYVLNAIAGFDQSKREKSDFKHKKSWIIFNFEKNRLDFFMAHTNIPKNCSFHNHTTYHYKCKITPKLRENVKQILDEIANLN